MRISMFVICSLLAMIWQSISWQSMTKLADDNLPAPSQPSWQSMTKPGSQWVGNRQWSWQMMIYPPPQVVELAVNNDFPPPPRHRRQFGSRRVGHAQKTFLPRGQQSSLSINETHSYGIASNVQTFCDSVKVRIRCEMDVFVSHPKNASKGTIV